MDKYDDLTGKIFDSNCCGKFEVLEINDRINKMKQYKVKFVATGFETLVFRTNVKKGAVLDKTIPHYQSKYKVGQILANPKGKQAKIIKIEYIQRKSNPKRKRTYITIEMLDTGYITTCNPEHFNVGKVKDYLSPTVMGVGMLGYVEHLEGRLRDMKEYRLWESMFRRCYQDSYETNNKSYENAYICDRWKRFDYFLEDVQYIEGYDLWKKYHEEYPDEKNIYEFDKDTKILGNKIYSPDTCRFLIKTINAGFTSWASKETKDRLLNTINGGLINVSEGNERCII